MRTQSRLTVRTVAFAVAIIVGAVAVPASADDSDHHLYGNAAGIGDLAIAASLGAAALGLTYIGPADEPRFQGGVLFDDDFRDAIRLENFDMRATVVDVADVLWFSTMGFPIVDALAVGIARGDERLALHLAASSLEAIAIAGFIGKLTEVTFSRERPYADQCTGQPGEEHGCGRPESTNTAFIAGHSATSFAAAVSTCVHHVNLRLYGNGLADATACTLALAGASTTTMMRMMADRHWATDSVVGAAVGVSVGLIVTSVHDVRVSRRREARVDGVRWTLAPTADRRSLGFGVLGWF